MKFTLIDQIIEQTEDRIVARKQVSLAEEYLADHFPSFPVLPGVMMLEAMVQAGRMLLENRGGARLVLGEVRALKFGSMVRPGEALRIEATLTGENDDGSMTLKATGFVERPGGSASARRPDAPEIAVSGRLTLRPIRADPSGNP